MKTCKACGCEKPVTEFHKDRSKIDGLNHYCKPCTIAKQKVFAARPARRKDPEGLKTCSHCKVQKPVSEFYASSGRHDGLDKNCKDCRYESHNDWRLKNLLKMAADQKRRRAGNPERYADYERKKLYGLEPGVYDAMFLEQGGKCAICKTSKPGGRGNCFHIDHCHDTGKVRSLLCTNCNMGLGQFKHDILLLNQAVVYLSRTSP